MCLQRPAGEGIQLIQKQAIREVDVGKGRHLDPALTAILRMDRQQTNWQDRQHRVLLGTRSK
jgi:hypothetical protein